MSYIRREWAAQVASGTRCPVCGFNLDKTRCINSYCGKAKTGRPRQPKAVA